MKYTIVNNTYGVRPAFVFNPNAVIYATAASVAESGSGFASATESADEKPAYKLYLKSSDYINYNQDTTQTAPRVSVSQSAVTVTRTGQTGDAVFLLSEKSGSGAVCYQAAASFSNGAASAALPSGVNANDYSITVLFLSETAGENSTETVTASYTQTGVQPPEDFSIEYLGRAITASDLAGADWYDAATYADATKMQISFSETPKDAGTYTVTFTLADGDLFWNDGTTEAKQITLTVTPKKISLTLSQGTDTVEPTYETEGVYEGDSPPEIKFRYASIDGAGYDSTSPPPSKGKYKATAFIEEGSNYALDGEYSIEFEITATTVSLPQISGLSSQTYTGEDLTFLLANIEAGTVNVTPPAGMTYDQDTGALTAKNAGTYTVTLSLTDPNDTCWPDGSAGSKTLSVTIAQRALSLSFGKEDGTWQWQTGFAQTVWVTYSNAAEGDEIALVLQYDGITLSATKGEGNRFTAEIPALETGSYTLGAALAAASSENANANYTLEGSSEQAFTVTARTAEFSQVQWQYENSGATVQIEQEADFSVTYNGAAFTISIAESGLAAQGVKVKSYENAAGTDAGRYTTTVTITALNDSWSYTDRSFTLTWTIERAKYDLSAASWNYTAPFTYDGTYKTVTLTGLPSGLTAQYYFNSYINSGDYTARVASFSNADSSNYVTPVQDDETTYEGTFAWILSYTIEKAKIYTEWTYETRTDKNGAEFSLAVLRADGDKVAYTYYLSDDTMAKGAVIAAEDIVVDPDSVTYYWAEVSLLSNYASNYELEGSQTSYFFSAGQDRSSVSVSGSGSGDSGSGGGINLPEGFPLWQVLACGASLVLIAVFAAKTSSYNKKRKQDKREAEKSRKKMYAFAPMFGNTAVLWGLSATVWTVAAFVLLGLALLAFAVMTGARRRRALAAEEAENEREQRNNDMKMMFMMMNNRGAAPGGAEGQTVYTAAPPYNGEVEEIVTRVVAAPLPAMQAQLPAASSDSTVKLIEQQARVLERQARMIEELQKNRGFDDDYDEEEDWSDEEEDYYEEADPADEIAPAESFADPADFTAEIPAEKRPRLPANFRIRLKLSSEKNRAAYAAIKNELNSFRRVTFRMSGRIEKVCHKGEPLAYIGVVRKSLKLWLALNPDDYDRSRYHQRDASDKKRYAPVPMLVRVGSDRALKRAEELIAVLAEKHGLSPKRRYEDKSLQELAYTLKGNGLAKDGRAELLRDVIHVHDADILSDEEAEKYLEKREKARRAKEEFATVTTDVLESNFYDGQKVTLERLQKKGLVPASCNAWRLTAGERLTKPLYVAADEYSPAAAKMILLTGGRAVRLTAPFTQKFL